MSTPDRFDGWAKIVSSIFWFLTFAMLCGLIVAAARMPPTMQACASACSTTLRALKSWTPERCECADGPVPSGPTSGAPR